MKSAVAIAASILVPLSVIVIHQALTHGNKQSPYSDIVINSFQKLIKGDVIPAEDTSNNLVEGKKEDEDTTPQFTGYRLPKDIVPQHYDLRLRTDLEAGTFEGTVDIKVVCVTPTAVVRLHSRGLEIDVKTIKVNKLEIKDGVEVPKEDSNNDFLIIKLKEKLTRGNHLLRIPFSGRLDRDLPGYRLLKYTQAVGNNQVINKLLAVTQFEPVYARKAFPCFDEPHMKATFILHLGHKKEYTGVSNMPLKKTTKPDVNGWVWDEFQTSAAMSTYTVAFMVSDLESSKFMEMEKEFSYEFWSRREVRTQLAFDSQNTPKLLANCEAFFDNKLPLHKVALVAVPNLSHGTKENWGLITFREEDVLIDESQSTPDAKMQARSIVARELAQQWFGSLVTMKWWSDFWLIKGVAFYASLIAVDQLFEVLVWLFQSARETVGFFDYIIGATVLKVFSLDSFQSSRPISASIENSRQIYQINDEMTYDKGMLVINMINSIVGLEEFQTGVSAYFKEFMFKATGEDDFWKAVAKAAGKKQVLPTGVSLKDVVDSWTKQAGYPVLTVKREGRTVTVSQKRFFKKKPETEDKEQACWFVPVTFANDLYLEYTTAPTPKMWLSCNQREITFDTGLPADSWIVLNNKASGIYRVNYDEQTWELFATILLDSNKRNNIPPVNRMHLISDAMEMAFVGQLSYQKAFGVLRSIRGDVGNSIWPWLAAMSSLEDLRNLLIRTEKFETFRIKVLTILQPLISRNMIGKTKFLQVTIAASNIISLTFSYSCKYEDRQCQQATDELWKLFRGLSQNWVPTITRGTVYCEVVRQGGADQWNAALVYYRETNIATEKRLFLESLACTKQEALLKKLLDLSLDESSGIRKQDSWRVFWTTADYSKLGFEVALKFLLNNLKAIYDYNKPNTSVLAKYFEVLAKKLVFKDEIDKMKQFVTANKNLLEDSWAGVTQATEQMDINLQWHETHYNTIEKSLSYLDPPSQSGKGN